MKGFENKMVTDTMIQPIKAWQCRKCMRVFIFSDDALACCTKFKDSGGE